MKSRVEKRGKRDAHVDHEGDDCLLGGLGVQLILRNEKCKTNPKSGEDVPAVKLRMERSLQTKQPRHKPCLPGFRNKLPIFCTEEYIKDQLTVL